MSNEEKQHSYFVSVPAKELGQVVFQVLRASMLGFLYTSLEIEQSDRVRLTTEQRRVLAMRVLGRILDGLPESAPFREALVRYVEEVVIPAVDTPPQRALRLVP